MIESQLEAERDSIAKVLSDAIGHGMREKCYHLADAVIAARSQPAAPRVVSDEDVERVIAKVERETNIDGMDGDSWDRLLVRAALESRAPTSCDAKFSDAEQVAQWLYRNGMRNAANVVRSQIDVRNARITELESLAPAQQKESMASWPVASEQQAKIGWTWNFDWMAKLIKRCEEVSGFDASAEFVDTLLSELSPQPAQPSVPDTVYICSNKECMSVFANDPNGPCPVCKPEGMGGWSTIPRRFYAV